jgi:NAD-dependent dihydropyrimidine dehydrogenase PreA subunit
MIELVFTDRCTGCGLCVEQCPTDVFDRDAAGKPVIARKDECQTCFLCEVHCPADALFVGPLRTPHHYDAQDVLASGNVGSLRRKFGFDKHAVGSFAYQGDYEARAGEDRRRVNPLDPNAKVFEKVFETERRTFCEPLPPLAAGERVRVVIDSPP